MMSAPQARPPRLGYRLLAPLLYPLWLLHALRHGGQHGLDDYRAMRMARAAPGDQARIWLHASSVGEVRAITPLVRALQARGEQILFTSFTATGYQAIRREFTDSLAAAVIPIDCAWHCRRFFARQRLRLGLVMETELWPELLYQARRHGIELLLVNARLSTKSLGSNRVARDLLGHTLGYFTQIMARNHDDSAALLSLGADPARITVCGNLKASRPRLSDPPRLVERDYLLLASSHAGEEQALLAARPAALREILLVIAPRHPARGEQIQAELREAGLNCAVRSLQQEISADTEVYLADTLGELEALMAHAQVVVMGGSFDETGGHNLIEPASLGCAIVTGPSDSNIRRDIEWLGNGRGVLQVADADACWQAVASLLAEPQRAHDLGRVARAQLASQADVLQTYLQAIDPYL